MNANIYTNKSELMMYDMIEKFNLQLRNNHQYSELDKKKIDFCIRILEFLKEKIHDSEETRYQKFCKYTSYIQYLEISNKQFSNTERISDLDKILYNLIACLTECRLSYIRENKNTDDLDSIFKWEGSAFMSITWQQKIIEKNLFELSDEDLCRFRNLFSFFPIKIINFYLGLPNYQALINHQETITLSESTKKQLTAEVKKANTAIKQVKDLETSISTLKTAYNFVGLSHGFENLLTEKKKSIYRSIGLLYVLGFLIILFPITKIFDVSIIHKSQENTLTSPHLIQVHNYTIDSNHSEQSNNINWTEILAGIALEFVLIYFFRVALNQYQITKTQIMQLELRRSLCQFIQSYAEYAQEIKEKDANALEKFENIIFSSILSHDANIPGTFDGMEHITSLIKELKGNK